ncbi:MAG TPA: tyrosine-type recombinase/integrase [Rhodanobacteraceae bacterium]
MTRTVCWHSFLGPEIAAFLAYKRSLRRRYATEERTLALFDAYLVQRHVTDLIAVTPTLVDAFLRSRPRTRPRSYNHLRCTVARLFAYLVARQILADSPLQSPPRRARYERTPFIFDVPAARKLLALARALPSTGSTRDRGQTYYLLFAILYGLGLRVGEACRLRVQDVDRERGLLVIRQTKFYKDRLAPFGPKLGALLAVHIQQREAELGSVPSADAPLFCLRGGRPINPCTVSQTFHALWPRLQLPIPPGISPPRLHDLRHAFAVGTLTRWYREGLDPQTRLLALSTFMGHVDVSSTAVYLTITPELLDQANRRFRTFAAAALTGELPT